LILKLFLIEGIITVLVSVIAYFFLSNYPEKAKWLNDEERKFAIERLKNDAGKAHATHFDKKHIYAALTDWVRNILKILMLKYPYFNILFQLFFRKFI
jgi:hypothetical protein